MAEYIDQQNIKNIIDTERKVGTGKKIVLASGLFDVVTVFDIRYLREAKLSGDVLVVAVYSDEAIRKKIDEKRPITPFEDRVEILKGMEMIDYIVRLEFGNMQNILNAINPDLIIDERVVGYDVVQAVLAKSILK